MKEDLFKKILILVLLLKGIISGNDIKPISDYQYVSINFIPYIEYGRVFYNISENMVKQFTKCLKNDLNISGALGEIFIWINKYIELFV